MLTLQQACKPRESVFDASRRDSVVDLTELADNRLDAATFFAESYPTDGMRTLIEQAFRRFKGTSDQGTFVLTQAMGGGKTHSMVALGLLARNPKLVKPYFPEYADIAPPQVKVVAFTGRESDAKFGIWGEIARQLGKAEMFNPYYSPLQAPGQSAWINLLQGSQPVLILLDELPPYFEAARAVPVGDSNLANVTTTALANLLSAVCKEELRQVVVVMGDLTAAYGEGSSQLGSALATMEREANRTAMRLEPVRLNSDELYHILRTRLFESLPDDAAQVEVAQGYADVMRQANQMDLTGYSPEETARQIRHSYPFHFSLRDLYARFRENPGYQQTRGLIRLMRMVVADLYKPQGAASRVHLIHPYHVNLNDPETVSEVAQINGTLRNAISHDVASGGGAEAEQIDADVGGGSVDARDAATLLLMASLSQVPGAVRGLTEEEVVACLATPGRALSQLKSRIVGPLLGKCWYLHAGTDNRIFFKDVQNLVARLKSTAETLTQQSKLKELTAFLTHMFTPSLKDCYQEVRVLPAVDEVQIVRDKVTLLVYEPSSGSALHPDLKAFYDNATLKNRVLFLSGDRGTLSKLLETAARLKAVRLIIDEMRAEKISENDPQYKAARDHEERTQMNLVAAARECFTRLTYPSGTGLQTCDFLMEFKGNEYNGEKQIRDALAAKQKFTTDVDGETFRKKAEQRLFTRQEMPWTDVLTAAAANPAWQWHSPGALEALRQKMILQEYWRDSGGYVNKGPFPPPATEVRVTQLSRDEKTGRVHLKLTAVNGDRIVYEMGSPATEASLPVTDPTNFETEALHLSFLCVDSTRKHATGAAVDWHNKIDLRYKIYEDGGDRMIELVAAPSAPIRYTTDGSDPAQNGGTYEGPIRVPASCVFVLANASANGKATLLKVEVPKKVSLVEPDRPVRWTRKQTAKTTNETYELIKRMRSHKAKARAARLLVTVDDRWAELSFSDQMPVEPDVIEKSLEFLRPLVDQGQVELDTTSLDFEKGQGLLDWVAEVKTSLSADEVRK